MKLARLLLHLAVLAVAALATGCAGNAYLANRGQDAADIFTATVGTGIGLEAKASFLNPGFYWCTQEAGLRGGVVADFGDCATDLNIASLGVEDFCGYGYMGGDPTPYQQKVAAGLHQRRKNYTTCGLLSIELTGKGSSDMAGTAVGIVNPILHLTRMELAGGLGLTFRLGLNLAELADFFLGWATVDFLHDDIVGVVEAERGPYQPTEEEKAARRRPQAKPSKD
ncbi:MAG: hypothetical protein KAI66_21520 [Lentisphaeria bacterium]|nr:hypothetical protein [Lentisphaeria bacterium]